MGGPGFDFTRGDGFLDAVPALGRALLVSAVVTVAVARPAALCGFGATSERAATAGTGRFR